MCRHATSRMGATSGVTVTCGRAINDPLWSCERYAANGVTIFHYRARRWHLVTAGSSFVTRTGGCRVPDVPKPLVKDFRLCGSRTPHTLAAATVRAPSRAPVGSRITVHAAARQARPPARVPHGRRTIGGYASARPGRHVLSLGILLPPAGFRGGSFLTGLPAREVNARSRAERFDTSAEDSRPRSAAAIGARPTKRASLCWWLKQLERFAAPGAPERAETAHVGDDRFRAPAWSSARERLGDGGVVPRVTPRHPLRIGSCLASVGGLVLSLFVEA
jgi:hypothetical protein